MFASSTTIAFIGFGEAGGPLDSKPVISAVTASSAGEVASDAGAHLRRGQVFLDIDSVSPDSMRANASRQEALIKDMQAVGIAFEPRQPFSWRRLADDLPHPPRRGELP
jgi:hypothetical protein